MDAAPKILPEENLESLPIRSTPKDRRRQARSHWQDGESSLYALKRITVLRRLPDEEKWVRLRDILGALVGLILFSPLLILAIIAIRCTSKGPIFFSQVRVGEGGRLFRMIKLRTMVIDAEAQKAQLMALNEMDGPTFKIAKDPRITRVGRILRKLSIDEMPQFWNVLRGDMSLVGPRPPLVKEVVQYRPWQLQRLAVKPGLTCLWQISGRNRIGFEDWVRLDIRYIQCRSFWLDLAIIVKTFKVLFISPDGT